jgi:hypothetical protein
MLASTTVLVTSVGNRGFRLIHLPDGAAVIMLGPPEGITNLTMARVSPYPSHSRKQTCAGRICAMFQSGCTTQRMLAVLCHTLGATGTETIPGEMILPEQLPAVGCINRSRGRAASWSSHCSLVSGGARMTAVNGRGSYLVHLGSVQVKWIWLLARSLEREPSAHAYNFTAGAYPSCESTLNARCFVLHSCTTTRLCMQQHSAKVMWVKEVISKILVVANIFTALATMLAILCSRPKTACAIAAPLLVNTVLPPPALALLWPHSCTAHNRAAAAPAAAVNCNPHCA